MIPQRWRRTEELFYAAEGLPGDERVRFLERECGDDHDLRREVDALLRSAGQTLHVVERSVQAVAEGMLRDESAGTGDRIGAYEIVRELGAGGMGVVFLARRADDEFQQLVAIKVLRFGLNRRELLLRFRAERQILANLVHPNIARLLDGGVTAAGQPYLVMEYVDGLPMLEYCQTHGLSVRQRLEMFRQVCAGVECAHRNLVVHRDLKPANVLVDAAGVPKLLDFGIAKMLAPEQADQTIALTTMTERLMTPEYASPEQVRGEAITTATDVYSLGVVLFELLTGARPLKFRTKTPTEIERVICESEPARPSTLTRLDTDLDTIVLRALDKSPARRYPTATELSEDIRRHLEGYPILARPDSLPYRARKFVLRNRWPVALATVAALLIIGFGIAMGVLANRAGKERDRAEQVSKYLLKMFETANPDKTGGVVTARQMLDAGQANLRQLEGRPEVQADLLQTLALSYESLGDRREAGKLTERALAIVRRLHGGGTEQSAQLLKNLAEMQRYEKNYEQAERSIRESTAIRERLLPPNDPLYLEGLNTLALVLQATRRLPEAEQLFLRVLAHRDKLAVREHLDTAVLSNLGGLYTDLGNYAAAEKYLRECIDIRRRTLGAQHPRLPRVLVRLGRVLYLQGRFEEAIPVLRETIAIQESLLGNGDPELPTSYLRLGQALQETGDLAAASKALEHANQLQLKVNGDREGSVAFQLASYASAQADWATAESQHRLVYEKRRNNLGAAHENTLRSELALATVRLNQGDAAGARTLVDSALPRLRAMPAMPELDLAEFDEAEARLLVAEGRFDAAEASYTAAIRRRRKVSDKHPWLVEPLVGLGRLYCETQRVPAGEALVRESLAILRPFGEGRKRQRLSAEASLAACLAPRPDRQVRQ